MAPVSVHGEKFDFFSREFLTIQDVRHPRLNSRHKYQTIRGVRHLSSLFVFNFEINLNNYQKHIKCFLLLNNVGKYMVW